LDPASWGRLVTCRPTGSRPARRLAGNPLGRAQLAKLPHKRIRPHFPTSVNHPLLGAPEPEENGSTMRID